MNEPTATAAATDATDRHDELALSTWEGEGGRTDPEAADSDASEISYR